MKVSKKPVVSIIFEMEKSFKWKFTVLLIKVLKWINFFDNNSTDQSVEIANGFQDKDSK